MLPLRMAAHLALLLTLIFTLGACSGQAVASITTSMTPVEQSTVVGLTAQPVTATALPAASTGPTASAVAMEPTAQPVTATAVPAASTGPTASAMSGTAASTPRGTATVSPKLAVTSAPVSPSATGVPRKEQSS